MKKVLLLTLVVCLAFCACFMTACQKENDEYKNTYADFKEFDSYVPRESEIIGVWKMTAPAADQEWQFFKDTTLHETKIQGDIRSSTVCTYNYDGEGTLRIYVFNDSQEYSYTVKIEGKSLTLTDKNNEKLVFEKIN